jgi:hypothetical protein
VSCLGYMWDTDIMFMIHAQGTAYYAKLVFVTAMVNTRQSSELLCLSIKMSFVYYVVCDILTCILSFKGSSKTMRPLDLANEQPITKCASVASPTKYECRVIISIIPQSFGENWSEEGMHQCLVRSDAFFRI